MKILITVMMLVSICMLCLMMLRSIFGLGTRSILRRLGSTVAVVAVTVIMFVMVPPTMGCSGSGQHVVAAAGSAASCELATVEQVAKDNGGTIAGEILSAVLSGGATLPALLDSLLSYLDPGTVRCAADLVAALEPSLVPPQTTAGSGTPPARQLTPAAAGFATLRAEVKKRGL